MLVLDLVLLVSWLERMLRFWLFMLICPLFVLSVLTALFALFRYCLSELTALFALAWRFEPTMVVVLLVLMLILLATRLEAIDWVCWAWS
ncbi:hypothetical protein BSPWISOXPB_1503 [uncultured Gammaproteobacteria bacterium]|nr:hypothetical protein BSPWISOXPB_1503 [uncultured Gammaproteobacteria bacterium]